eukprot:tig00000178_g12788.t1
MAFVSAIPVLSAGIAVAPCSSTCAAAPARRTSLKSAFSGQTAVGHKFAAAPISFAFRAPITFRPVPVCSAQATSNRVNIDTADNDFVVTVEAADREGLLEGLLAIFRGFGFAVSKASVQTVNTQVHDVFHIRHTEITDAQALNNDILPSLQDALMKEIGAPAKPKTGNVRHCNVNLKGNRVFVADNAAGTESEISVETTDRSHLLHELVSTMKYLELNVHSAEISTEGDRVFDKFVVSSKGKSLSEGRKAAIVNALTTVLLCDPGSNVISDDHDSY